MYSKNMYYLLVQGKVKPHVGWEWGLNKPERYVNNAT